MRIMFTNSAILNECTTLAVYCRLHPSCQDATRDQHLLSAQRLCDSRRREVGRYKVDQGGNISPVKMV